MEGINTEFEILHVSESVCLPFEQFDFVIDTFYHSGSEGMIEVVQDAGTMGSYGAGEFHDRRNPAGPGFLEPVFQIHLGLSPTGAGPECA